MLLYKRVLLLISIIVSFVISINMIDTISVYSYWFLIPVFYGVFFYLLIPNNIIIGPGFFIANIVLFLRYILYPLLLVFYGLPKGIQVQYWPRAVCLMMIEIMVLLITYRFFCGKTKKQLPELEPDINVSIEIVLFLFLIYVYLIIRFPNIFVNRHFIMNHSLINEDLVSTKAGRWSVIIRWLEYLIVLLFLNNVYIKRRSYILCFIVLMTPRLFYEGHSRLSILTPLIVSLFLLLSLFPIKKKITVFVGTLLIVVSMTLLTMSKVYQVNNLNQITIRYPHNDLNAYFGGVDNVAIGIACYESYKESIDYEIIINDMFRNMLVVNQYFNSSKSSPSIFNSFIHGRRFETEDQIIPTLCQGLFYFGYALFWILPMIMVIVTCYADKKYYQSNNLTSAWLFGMLGATVGWAIPGSFQHLYMCLYYTFIPMWIIFKVFNVRIKWQ